MKNKKLSILFQSMRRIDEQTKKPNLSPQQSTIKTSFTYNQNSITATAVQILKLQKLFTDIKLLEVVQDFSQYLTLPSQILGKRSSKIILSKSSKYCLKIVQQQDLLQIQSIFQSLLTRFQNKKQNCLVNIYLIFMVDYTISGVKLGDRYIIMPNIRADFDHCIRGFDIKGHLEARAIDHEDFIDFKFGKDENFVQSDELILIKQKLSKQTLKNIIKKIQENVHFLTKNNIIDYSLLFSLQKKNQSQTQLNEESPCPQIRLDNGKVFKFVIIDYFQIYNDKKKFQNRFKSMFRKTISSVEPQTYSQRLISFLQKYLLN